MILSRFSHIFQLNNDVFAYYNSLFLKPVYLNAREHMECRKLLDTGYSCLDDEILSVLYKYHIVIKNSCEDDEFLEGAKAQLLSPYPVITYFILSEKCNLACKYCFLGNADKDIVSRQMPMMSKDVAQKSLTYLSFQLKLHPEWFDNEKEIIFYGGEPLLNFEILKYVVDESNKMKATGDLPRKLHFSMVTNGLLLDKEKIEYLRENEINISISVDGIDYESNVNRVDKSGNDTYKRLMAVLELIRECGWDVGLSITLTERTIEQVDDIIALIEKYKIAGVSFNILHPTKDFKVNDSYYERASDFIIQFFLKARKYGIYEDRIYRKLDAFVDGKLYLSDCAATSGSQITILPNGQIGICHGCLENKEYFFTHVEDRTPIESYPEIIEWSQISPITKEYCYSCEALGICGGGCPLNGTRSSGRNISESIDDSFCIHAKKTLNFMIKDLYNIITNGEPLDEINLQNSKWLVKTV